MLGDKIIIRSAWPLGVMRKLGRRGRANRTQMHLWVSLYPGLLLDFYSLVFSLFLLLNPGPKSDFICYQPHRHRLSFNIGSDPAFAHKPVTINPFCYKASVMGPGLGSNSSPHPVRPRRRGPSQPAVLCTRHALNHMHFLWWPHSSCLHFYSALCCQVLPTFPLKVFTSPSPVS